LRANGQAVSDPQRLIGIIRATKPGQRLSLEVWSRGVKRLASVSVSERPADYYQPNQQEQP